MMISLTRAQNIDLDVAYFRDNGIVSTAENIAVFFWRALARDDAEIGKLVCLVALLVCSAKFFVVAVCYFSCVLYESMKQKRIHAHLKDKGNFCFSFFFSLFFVQTVPFSNIFK